MESPFGRAFSRCLMSSTESVTVCGVSSWGSCFATATHLSICFVLGLLDPSLSSMGDSFRGGPIATRIGPDQRNFGGVLI